MSLSGPPSAEEVVAALVGTSPRRRKGRTPAEGLTQTARARTRAVSRLDLRGVSVLVVEDHPDSRELLREIVESFGATVVVAGDGRSPGCGRASSSATCGCRCSTASASSTACAAIPR